MRIEHWLYTLPLRLRSLFRRGQVEQELDEELRYHLERQTEELVATGLTAEEARFAALRAMGGVEQHKEECRDTRRVRFVEDVVQDLHYGARTMLKNRGLTGVAVLSLALGIGANSAIFSVVNAVLLAPLRLPAPERLVSITEPDVREAEDAGNASYPDYVDYRERNRSFADMAAYSNATFSITVGDEPERVQGAIVSASLFSTLQVNPLLGRSFLPEEDRKGGAPVVVISHSLWQRRFAGDPNAIGKTVVVEGRSTTVVGVMPAGFQFPFGTDQVDVWGPVGATSVFMDSRGARFLQMVGRLGDGVTAQQAKADLDAIAEGLEQQYPTSNTGYRTRVRPLQEALVGDVRAALLILFGAVGFVLLIACANVANLLLTRALARETELSIRAALGASRWRLARQMLTESLLLSLAGGALGLLVATWGAGTLAAMVADQIPRASEISLDGRVVAFTVVVSVLTGVLFGLAPTMRLAHTDPNDALKEGGRGSTEGARHNRVRSLLVIGEVAVSVVLLVGAGLLIRSFVGLIRVDTGFKANNVVTMQLTIPDTTFDDDPLLASAFYETVLERVGALPGVKAAAAATTLPLSGSDLGLGFDIVGKTSTEPADRPAAPYDAVSPGYFRAMGIPILRGREFTERDTKERQAVIVVSDAFARRYWPDEDPIGKHVKPGYRGGEAEAPEREIVGVVGNLKHAGLRSEAGAAMYTPLSQTPWPFASLVVVTDSDPSSLAAAVRREVLAIDTNQPISDVKLLDRIVSDSVSQPRLYMSLLAVFAGVALALTAIGIYGVIANSVRRRTHEIGVRMALGATARDVLRLIIAEGMSLVLVGVAVGFVAAFAATRLIESMLFGVSSSDLLTSGGVGLLLACVAFLAILIPARRAARLDPMVALRWE